MKRYEGKRVGQAVDVTVNGVPLNPRLDLWNHSPTGFEWGYAGSGPAQLALALLSDCLGEENAAVEWHHDFKAQVVANLPFPGWVLTEQEIHDTIAVFQNQ